MPLPRKFLNLCMKMACSGAALEHCFKVNTPARKGPNQFESAEINVFLCKWHVLVNSEQLSRTLSTRTMEPVIAVDVMVGWYRCLLAALPKFV